MRRISWQSKTIVLIVLFIILVFGGRYVFSQKSRYSSTATTTPIHISDSTENNSQSSEKTAPATAPKKDTSVSGCITELKNKVATNKTDYEKGSILVGFKEGVTFADAERTLATYGSVIRDMQYAKENYDSRRLLTASVKSGEEFSKICIIKNDASVRYTGLNEIFSLHD